MKTKGLLLILAFCVTGLSLFATSTITTWMKDMYNQPSVKPQGKDSIVRFPENVVSTKGVQYHPPRRPFPEKAVDFQSYQAPQNNLEGFEADTAEGRLLFLTFCAACHGRDGRLNNGKGTPISLKGLKVRAMQMRPVGFYYDRLSRGGAQMPPLAYRMSERERWQVAHYVKNELGLTVSSRK